MDGLEKYLRGNELYCPQQEAGQKPASLLASPLNKNYICCAARPEMPS